MITVRQVCALACALLAAPLGCTNDSRTDDSDGSSSVAGAGAGGSAGSTMMGAGSGGMSGAGSGGMSGAGMNAGAGAGGTTSGSGGAAGAMNAGRSGMGAGMGGAGMAGSTAGSGDCEENLGCQLDPPPSTGDAHQDCVDRINQFRTQCACLPPLERWTDGEACADMMAEYDSTRDAHAGFRANICEGGSAQNECPGWRSEPMIIDRCLQGMWDEGPPPQNPCEDDCFQEHGHFINMTSTRSKRVACGFYMADNGEITSVQNFSR